LEFPEDKKDLASKLAFMSWFIQSCKKLNHLLGPLRDLYKMRRFKPEQIHHDNWAQAKEALLDKKSGATCPLSTNPHRLYQFFILRNWYGDHAETTSKTYRSVSRKRSKGQEFVPSHLLDANNNFNKTLPSALDQRARSSILYDQEIRHSTSKQKVVCRNR
jgi:hypothetical protein